MGNNGRATPVSQPLVDSRTLLPTLAGKQGLNTGYANAAEAQSDGLQGFADLTDWQMILVYSGGGVVLLIGIALLALLVLC